jgi:DNA processing protein
MPGGEGRAPRPVWLSGAALPDCFGGLSHRPEGLWCLGDPSSLVGAPARHVAIVGTREASAYGERTARRFAAACARHGLVVVSGLARGVDAAAHRGALEVGGRTIAVLGTGADVPYPAGHRTLHGEVARSGAVVSEMEPGTTAKPGCFPRRNRIIAALAQVTVVIEAGFKSGAINTANWANDLGRTVAAAPGQCDDPRAAGSNQLLRDGAQVLGDVEDLLNLFELSTSGGQSTGPQRGPTDPIDAALFSLLGPAAQDLEILAFQAGMTGRQVSDRLLRLELEGFAERTGAGYRRGVGAR